MREIQGDLFAQKGDAVAITTNGFTNAYGANVMGAGVAKEAMKRCPWLPRALGAKLQKEGNKVHWLTEGIDLIKEKLNYHLVSFPTKPIWATSAQILPRYRGTTPDRHGRYPGWMAFSSAELIYCSALELVALTDEQGWHEVLLPPAGCGMGGLNWKEVGRQLAEVLDDRFVVVHYPRR